MGNPDQAAYFLAKYEEYHAKALATTRPGIGKAFEAVARECLERAQNSDPTALRVRVRGPAFSCTSHTKPYRLR